MHGNDPLIAERDIVRAQIEKATRKFLRAGGKVTLLESLSATVASRREVARHETSKDRKRIFRELFKKIKTDEIMSSKAEDSARRKIAAHVLGVQRRRVSYCLQLKSAAAPTGQEIEALRRYIEQQQ